MTILSASSDERTLRAAIAGNHEAFRSLVLMHQSGIRRLLLRLTGYDEAGTDDLAQEVFITVFDRLDTFRFESSFKSWLYRIAYNKFLDGQRRQSRGIEDPVEADLPVPSQTETQLDVQRVLRIALAKLKPDMRSAVVLTAIEEFTHEEAAEAMGLPLGTIKSHVLRGKEQLRNIFIRHGLEVSL